MVQRGFDVEEMKFLEITSIKLYDIENTLYKL